MKLDLDAILKRIGIHIYKPELSFKRFYGLDKVGYYGAITYRETNEKYSKSKLFSISRLSGIRQATFICGGGNQVLKLSAELIKNNYGIKSIQVVDSKAAQLENLVGWLDAYNDTEIREQDKSSMYSEAHHELGHLDKFKFRRKLNFDLYNANIEDFVKNLSGKNVRFIYLSNVHDYIGQNNFRNFIESILNSEAFNYGSVLLIAQAHSSEHSLLKKVETNHGPRLLSYGFPWKKIDYLSDISLF